MFSWDPNPELTSIGFLTIRWYGIFFAAAFLVGFQIMLRIYVKEGRPSSELDRLLFYMMLGTVIGARLGHCIFYDPQFYLTHPLEILKVWKGGLASHGGGLGLLLAIAWFVRKTEGISFLWLVDRIAIPTALGGAFIRIANFINSEIVGLPTHGNWGVIFERVDTLPRHPVQLYEATAYLLVFFLLLWVYRRSVLRLRQGAITGLFLILVFSARLLLEFYKTPQASFRASEIFSMGQLLSMPFIIVGLVLLFNATLREKVPKPSGRV